ncbi:type I iodothyronine deiodinase-like [Haliotis cracherodii]|uniref:type I iodothyronine deiodinase-like n=1 Tax=Haliotis cracherodii TaxID=6455 RepID=UPI0039E78AF2
MVDKFSHCVDFLVVYIEEAHPVDGWYFRGNKYNVQTSTKLEDRATRTNYLKVEQVTCPIVIDDMSDNANKKYSALPERLYVISDGVIEYAGGSGPMFYSLQELEHWLNNYCKQHTVNN